MDGYEVARLAARSPDCEHMTLVAMTGYGKDEESSARKQAGFNAHLVKPVNVDDLRLLLDTAGAVPPILD